jgi:hypothetical protein
MPARAPQAIIAALAFKCAIGKRYRDRDRQRGSPCGSTLTGSKGHHTGQPSVSIRVNYLRQRPVWRHRSNSEVKVTASALGGLFVLEIFS